MIKPLNLLIYLLFGRRFKFLAVDIHTRVCSLISGIQIWGGRGWFNQVSSPPPLTSGGGQLNKRETREEQLKQICKRLSLS